MTYSVEVNWDGLDKSGTPRCKKWDNVPVLSKVSQFYQTHSTH